MIDLLAGSASAPCPITIDCNLIGQLGERLKPYAQNNQLIVVSDNNVWDHHGRAFIDSCAGLQVQPIVIAPGERSKSWGVLEGLVERLLERGVNRESTLVAFGGGVVGDLVGFAASVIHRGCKYVQIPTSLLSQVDSSVGGKTAINSRRGKNQVGSFHAPAMVLIDPTLLRTLPMRELRAGYAELVKVALINDPPFFSWLERHGPTCFLQDGGKSSEAIGRAVEGKIELVRGDEFDRSGQRMLLNFGHTFGHAIEAQTRFEILHGEAVAIGIILAFSLSHELGYCSGGDVDRVRQHLSSAGLAITLKELGINAGKLAPHFALDKKVVGGAPRFIMSRGIGQAFVDHQLSVERVSRFLSEHS